MIRWIDSEGRLFGRVNALDLLIAVGILTLIAAIIVTQLLPNRPLAAVRRMATPLRVDVDLALHAYNAWLVDQLVPGPIRHKDDGTVSAAILGHTSEQTSFGKQVHLVQLRLLGRREPADRLFYEKQRLTPGAYVEIDGTGIMVAGTVYRVTEIAETAP